MLKGYRKVHPQKDARRPVSFSILQVIRQLGGVCSSDYELILFRAAFFIGFFGAFSVGELVSPSRWVSGGLTVPPVFAWLNGGRCGCL